MATYIPNITDYIPQFQPFTPDYNFLGNVLQNAQSKYDSNYKALSKTYGTLLNSPMLREDNIKQREEYFKMIDQDIKKMSGLDLSLQQNVDAANAVFDSFYKNKNMVKDMVFTKEYQNQLQTAENYRNCIDQEKCGGKYWDTGRMALDYKADEFKKASREESMTMSPGRFTPFINIQEKAMTYAKGLLGKGSEFGITSVGLDKSGRYIVTTKNGAQLEVPLNQLLSNQYGQDPAIQEMFQTQSYVNRKSYIQQNLERFGGNENAAEDDYFNKINHDVMAVREAYDNTLRETEAIKAKNTIIKKEIETKGTTGYDQLSDDYVASSIDSASSELALSQHEETYKVANSIFEAGDNRQMKRQRVDALLARTAMNREFRNAAASIAAMTGEQSMVADPYAKSYYDFSLDMSKMKTQYDLMDRNTFRKTMYDLSKQQALEQFKKRGSAIGLDNVPVYADGFKGTTSTNVVDELQEIQDRVGSDKKGVEGASLNFTTGYANTLVGIIDNPNSTAADRTLAKVALNKLYGVAAKVKETGSYNGRVGYDSTINKFVDANGNVSSDPKAIANNYNPEELYNKVQQYKKDYRSIPSQKQYFEKEGAEYEQEYKVNKELLDVSTSLWKQNNLNVKNFAETDASAREELSDIDDKLAWRTRFTKDGDLKSPTQFVKDFVTNYMEWHKDDTYVRPRGTEYYNDPERKYTQQELQQKAMAIAKEKFEKTDDVYNKLYNSGSSQGGNVPVVKPLKGSTEFSYFGGGKSAGGASVFNYATDAPASLGLRGMVTLADDALSDAVADSGQIVVGNYGSTTELNAAVKAGASTNARAALKQYISDIKAGKLTGKNLSVGKVAYMDTALGNDEFAGMIVSIPQDWAKKYKGTAKAPTWADDQSIFANGISVYVRKDNAKNAFTEAYRAKPYDIILDHKDQTIEYPNAGSVKILKRAADGTFSVQGQVTAYDADGKPHQLVIPGTYSKETGGQNLYMGLQKWLQEISTVNTAYLENRNVDSRLYDPRHLPAIKSMLNQQAGDDPTSPQNLQELFLQQVSINSPQ